MDTSDRPHSGGGASIARTSPTPLHIAIQSVLALLLYVVSKNNLLNAISNPYHLPGVCTGKKSSQRSYRKEKFRASLSKATIALLQEVRRAINAS